MANKLIQLKDGADNVFPCIGYKVVDYSGDLTINNNGFLDITALYDIPSDAVVALVQNFGTATGGFNVCLDKDSTRTALFLYGTPNSQVKSHLKILFLRGTVINSQ